MFTYIAAAVAALALSATAPAAMAEPEVQTIVATCTPTLNGEAGTPETCQVIVMQEQGLMGVGFVLQTSGSALYLGVPNGQGGVDVGAISVDDNSGGESPTVEATGSCAAQGNVIVCTATVGTATLMVKAVA